MSKYMFKRINELCVDIKEANPFLDFGKGVAKAVGREIGRGLTQVAGTAVTALARTNPITAAFGDILGQKTTEYLDKLFKNHPTIKDDVRANKYFYKDDYRAYQSGNYGYDLDLPRDKFVNNELVTIKKYIYPTFRKLGYTSKVIGKRNEERVYLTMLFKGNSRIPKLDSKRNPVLYPIPFDLFQNMTSESETEAIVSQLVNLYGLQ